LFAVPRILAGPIAGATVVALGWPVFYLSTMLLGIPGLLMLARFVPPGVREPAFDAEEPPPPVKRPLARSELVSRGVAGGAVIGIATLAIAALLSALEGLRATPRTFDYLAALSATALPSTMGLWLQLVGILAFAAIGGLFVAAWSAARGRTTR
jgi:PAT family beta-lactamase induction signal transducer AmpG